MAERNNRQLLEVTRCLLLARNVPKVYWSDAILSTAYLINRMPSKTLNLQTLIQILRDLSSNDHPLNCSLPFKIFGCVAFIHV